MYPHSYKSGASPSRDGNFDNADFVQVHENDELENPMMFSDDSNQKKNGLNDNSNQDSPTLPSHSTNKNNSSVHIPVVGIKQKHYRIPERSRIVPTFKPQERVQAIDIHVMVYTENKNNSQFTFIS